MHSFINLSRAINAFQTKIGFKFHFVKNTIKFKKNSSKIHYISVKSKTSELLLMPVLKRKLGLQLMFYRSFSPQNEKTHFNLERVTMSISKINIAIRQCKGLEKQVTWV
jgi:hypothetical protein